MASDSGLFYEYDPDTAFCRSCGSLLELDHCDGIGADDGCVFCEVCGEHVHSITGEVRPLKPPPEPARK